MLLGDMRYSNIQRLVLGTGQSLNVDLAALIQAPRLEIIDMWCMKAAFNFTSNITPEILPTERPLLIKIDAEVKFGTEDFEAMERLGFEITHSRPSCACCGTALSSWFAKYSNETYETEGFSKLRGLPKRSSNLPCNFETCQSCKEGSDASQLSDISKDD